MAITGAPRAPGSDQDVSSILSASAPGAGKGRPGPPVDRLADRRARNRNL